MTKKYEFIAKLNETIEGHYHRDDFGVRDLALKLNISRSQLHRKIIFSTGMSAGAYINEFRLKKALILLQQGKFNASEVAYKVGFNSPSYFSTAFKKYYGCSPSQVSSTVPENNNHSNNELDHTKIENDVLQNKSQQISSTKYLSRKKILIIFPIMLLVSLFVVVVSSSYFKSKNSKEKNPINSIAVLPIKNYSGDPNMDVFCYSLTDEVLTKLSKLSNFDKIISMTSSFKYKDSKMSIPEISSELGVSYILEGNIQKADNKFRVNVQLINAKEDDHIWADQYSGDWESKDIFEIQEKITDFVLNALKILFSNVESESVKKKYSNIQEANDLFFQAKFYLFSGDEENIEKARDLLNRVVELDSIFANAYFELGYISTLDGFSEGRKEQVIAWNKGKYYLNKAKELDPSIELIELVELQGYFYFDWDFRRLEEFYHSKFLVPNYDRISCGLIDYAIKTGRFENALVGINKSIESNPLEAILYTFKARTLWLLGEKREGVNILDQMIKFNTQDWFFLRETAHNYFMMQEYDKAKEATELLFERFEDNSPVLIWFKLFFANYEQNNKVEVDLLDKLHKAYESGDSGSPGWFIALYHVSVKKDKEKAFEWLEKSYEKREVELTWLKLEKLLEPLRNDERYWSLYNRIGFNQIDDN